MPQPYLSLEAEWHDAFWNAEDGGSELRLMADFLREFPGRALEVGSGSGRLMLPLLQQGFAIEGLELSPDMRAIAAARAAQAGIPSLVHDGDMTTWQPANRYQAILAPAFTLQLADDPAATLRHWHRWLEPGGGLYLTTFIPYGELLGEWPEDRWYLDREITLENGRHGVLETRHQLDRERQILHREHRYRLKGKPAQRHECRQQIRWLDHPQMLDALSKADFEPLRCFLDFDPRMSANLPDHHSFSGVFTYHATKPRSPAGV